MAYHWVGSLTSLWAKDNHLGERHLGGASASSYRIRLEDKWYFLAKYVEILVDNVRSLSWNDCFTFTCHTKCVCRRQMELYRSFRKNQGTRLTVRERSGSGFGTGAYSSVALNKALNSSGASDK